MIEFFIALFGILYYGTRYFADKSWKKYIDIEDGKKRKIAASIDNTIHNRDIETKTKQKARKDLVRMFEEEVSDDIEYVLGSNWENRVLNEHRPRGSEIRCPFLTPYDVAYNIWLSSKGYVSSSIGRCYRLATCNDEWRATIIKACVVIERNIRKFHPELNMVVNPDVTSYNSKSEKEIYKQEIEWEHNRTTFESIGEPFDKWIQSLPDSFGVFQ